MSTVDGRWSIVLNGEIYNYRQIRAELSAEGYTFRGSSDTEVVLLSWEKWGWEAVHKLRGMFAFAVWDGVKETLWLVRDRMGEKPLYYSCQKECFLFASEIRSLLASNVVERRLDPDGIDSYLTFGSVTGPSTIVKGIFGIEPGTILKVEADKVQKFTYWSIKDFTEIESPSLQRIEVVEAVSELIRDAVRSVMVADVPVAVLLSGGIDSSSNVAILSESGFNNLSTYSVVFDEAAHEFSERPWIQLVVDRYRTNHTYVNLSYSNAKSLVTAGVLAMDQPSWDGINTYLVCKAIHDAGVKVAITGQGADELFLGYPTRKHFGSLLTWTRFPKGPASFVSSLLYKSKMLPDSAFEKMLQTPQGEYSIESAYLAQHSMFSELGLRRLRGSRRPSQLRFVKSQGGTTPLTILSRLELTHYLRNTLLKDGDQMSMAHSLELRAPFVDHKVVEKLVQLPSNTKVEQNRQKPLLVDAVGASLPTGIASRPKHGFDLPIGIWLRNGLRLSGSLPEETGLDRSAVADVEREFMRGKHYSRFWSLHVLMAWSAANKMSPPTE